MKVSVLVMVVAGLVWTSTVEYGEAITSQELCEQIRSNEHHILTMGARGRTLDDAHFYILVEGGYMFKVPLANLHVNATSNTTSITIDREYIRADALFNVSRGLFTRKYRFFLISNQNHTTNIVTVFYYQENPKKEDGYYYILDTDGLLTVSRRKHALEWNRMDFSRDQYFEVNLSSFVVCHFKQTTTDPSAIEWTYWIVALCLGTIVVLGGFAVYFYVGMKKEKAKRRDLKKKNRQNMFNLSSLASSNLSSSSLNSSNISSGTSSSNASSNAFTLTSNPTTSSSSMASKASSVLQSVKSGISSLLNRNKSKQANTVAKAKKSKAKANKPKSPK